MSQKEILLLTAITLLLTLIAQLIEWYSQF